MAKFATEIDAKTHREEELEDCGKDFCPLIKGMCRPDCVCFTDSLPRNIVGNKGAWVWVVGDIGCDNDMYKGRNE